MTPFSPVYKLLMFLWLLGGPTVHSWTAQNHNRRHGSFLVSSSRLHGSTCCEPPPATVLPSSTTVADTQNFQTFFTPKSVSHDNPWNVLVPFLPNAKGCDVILVWEEPEQAVDDFLRLLQRQSDTPLPLSRIRPTLLQSFAKYASLMPNYPKYKARIVATRGGIGTKCPRYHSDHVPLRWIQSLVGPGCDYVVGEEGVRRDLLNHLDELTSSEANKLLVQEGTADIRQGLEGEAVVLVGSENDQGIPGAVHKSPNLLPWQGRVILVMDVVRD